MATRQYIGARYVPTFANPVEWDNNRSYEPLTIVTYYGTSYTSKKPVPVGIEINNTEYWVVTGNYNAQVEAYRQETVELAGDVDTLSEAVNNRKVVRRGRPKVFWNSGSVASLGVYETNMTGFRYMGHDYNENELMYIPRDADTFDRHAKVSTSATAVTSLNSATWLAIFGVVDRGNAGRYKTCIVPIMQVLSVSGSTLTVGKTTENTNGASLTGGIVDNIFNRDVLVITRNGRIAGDVTKITAYSGDTVTLENSTDIAEGDYILIAPAPENEYVYFASHYYDGEWRNREDDGRTAWSRGVNDTEHTYADMIYTTQEPTNGIFKLRNCCSPMATAVIVNVSLSYSSTSAGNITFTVGANYPHRRVLRVYKKTAEVPTVSFIENMCWIGFDYMRSVFIGFQTDIPTAASVSIQPWGWVEP